MIHVCFSGGIFNGRRKTLPLMAGRLAVPYRFDNGILQVSGLQESTGADLYALDIEGSTNDTVQFTYERSIDADEARQICGPGGSVCTYRDDALPNPGELEFTTGNPIVRPGATVSEK